MATYIVYSVTSGIGKRNLTSTRDKLHAEYLVSEFSLSLGSGTKVYYRAIDRSIRGTKRLSD